MAIVLRFSEKQQENFIKNSHLTYYRNIMKKILFIILLLFSCGLAYGQNTIYATIQPTDLGYGLRYDKVIKGYYAYTSISKGEYKMIDGGYIKDHIKVAIGGIVTCPYFYKESFLSCGISYHHYGKYYLPTGICGNNTFTPLSLELGVGSKFNKITAAFRIDVFKYESSLDLGYNF
jgi:hypothetical protein